MSDFPSLLWRVPGAADLDLTSLTGDGFDWWAAPGIDGLDIPPLTTADYESALADGGAWTGARFGPRRVFIPITIDSDGFTGRQEARRLLTAAFFGVDRLRAAPVSGSLAVRYSGGGERELTNVRLVGGLSAPDPGPGPVTVGLELTAYDPLFYGAEQDLSFTTSGVPFFPGPPFSLTPESVSATTRVAIPGELPVWPVWTIQGPVSTFAVSNGESAWRLPGPLTGAESLTIRTDPRTLLSRRITDQAGANVWPAFAADEYPDFFAFPPGLSETSIVFTGTTTDTRVGLSWRPAYLTW